MLAGCPFNSRQKKYPTLIFSENAPVANFNKRKAGNDLEKEDARKMLKPNEKDSDSDNGDNMEIEPEKSSSFCLQ